MATEDRFMTAFSSLVRRALDNDGTIDRRALYPAKVVKWEASGIFPSGTVDVMPWAARTSSAPQYRKGARTLATMSHRHGVVLESAHTASDDAEACGWLMLSLMRSGAMPAELGDVVEATRPTRR
jgi:hypothetical protein